MEQGLPDVDKRDAMARMVGSDRFHVDRTKSRKHGVEDAQFVRTEEGDVRYELLQVESAVILSIITWPVKLRSVT